MSCNLRRIACRSTMFCIILYNLLRKNVDCATSRTVSTSREIVPVNVPGTLPKLQLCNNLKVEKIGRYSTHPRWVRFGKLKEQSRDPWKALHTRGSAVPVLLETKIYLWAPHTTTNQNIQTLPVCPSLSFSPNHTRRKKIIVSTDPQFSTFIS